MEAVILIGIQGAGKSTFCRQRFFDTHVRVNLDMLHTRNKEEILVRACVQAGQPFVVDNTNPTAEVRARYFRLAKGAGFRMIAYYFPPDLPGSMERNRSRQGKRCIPEPAIAAAAAKMQPPTFAEGFDEIYHVRPAEEQNFLVEEIRK
jgi:predicted kinase